MEYQLFRLQVLLEHQLELQSNSIKTINKTNLSEQTKFRQSEIIGIANYFYQEINQRKSYSKKLNKCCNF